MLPHFTERHRLFQESNLGENGEEEILWPLVPRRFQIGADGTSTPLKECDNWTCLREFWSTCVPSKTAGSFVDAISLCQDEIINMSTTSGKMCNHGSEVCQVTNIPECSVSDSVCNNYIWDTCIQNYVFEYTHQSGSSVSVET